jgi:hypothetical protein
VASRIVKKTGIAWYLQDRMQRVVLEGQSSEWKKLYSGVPQGSVLGPLLFLIYVNDITDNLESKPFVYADDTTLFEVVDDPVESAENLNNDLAKISEWSDKWLVTMNPSKTRSMLFSLKRDKIDHPELTLRGVDIEEVSSHTHLGLTFQNKMSWNKHVLEIYEKASKRLNVMKSFKFHLDRSTLRCLYTSLIRPQMDMLILFGIIVHQEIVIYSKAFNTMLLKLLQVQLKAPVLGNYVRN